MRHQSFNFGGHIVYSRTVPEVEQSARELLQKIKGMEKNMEPVSLGFDIEWKPAFGRGMFPVQPSYFSFYNGAVIMKFTHF